ncbi:DUF4974 domain-containing protein [Sphingobacterium sp. SGG-5]|uniref:FecR family protein n=1 Tax=Sphingobacterium sp. SGG-5 TaxID=2710881 RepID=UPI0013EBF2EB|nr:FecR domain-containing protein [Sphingobacterium sp. SGG-5]NGM61581.1 DUF4974 domain-containing protein [Sphingobacterium sp. SGG-5]
MSEPRIDKELIKKYLAGNADKSEKDLVEYFIQQKGAIDMFEKVWEEQYQDMNIQPSDKISDPVRMEKWKAVIREKIDQKPGTRPVGKLRFFTFGQVAIWAILLLGSVLWGVSKFMDKPNPSKVETEWTTYTTSNGKRAIIRLSDSTVIYLGAESSLTYPTRFAAHERKVRLEGEAFFEVARDTNRPFLVISEDVVTQVLGTSFKVESFNGSPTLVSVSSGKVRVSQRLENQELRLLADLTKGQQVAWDRQKDIANTSISTPISADTFMSGKLIFEDRPLAEIVEALKRNYNLEIKIQRPSLAKRPIRIILEKNLTRRQIMDVIAAAGGFKYALDKNNGNITIF